MQYSSGHARRNKSQTTDRPATIAARQLAQEVPVARKSNETSAKAAANKYQQDAEMLASRVEARLVAATWTLRRMPDREKNFLHMRTMMWPDAVAEAGTYAPQEMTALQARRNVRLSPQEIDQMQPALDLLQLLPDPADRKLLFWVSWHQDGEVQVKLPWAKVRRSMECGQSRWTMKRRYQNGLQWLASIILAQT